MPHALVSFIRAVVILSEVMTLTAVPIPCIREYKGWTGGRIVRDDLLDTLAGPRLKTGVKFPISLREVKGPLTCIAVSVRIDMSTLSVAQGVVPCPLICGSIW